MALVRNATARISSTGYETLVQKSRNLSGLQEPLIRRPDLPPQLATDMCDWVSDALKTYIKNNYSMSAKTVSDALSKANTVVKSEPAGPKDPPADSAQKLIEKMAASGQLKAGFLMRVLSQGQLDLFDLAFARLVECRTEPIPQGLLRRRRASGGAVLPRRRHRPFGLSDRFQPVAPGAWLERDPGRRRHAGGRYGLFRLHAPERVGRAPHRLGAVNYRADPALARAHGPMCQVHGLKHVCRQAVKKRHDKIAFHRRARCRPGACRHARPP